MQGVIGIGRLAQERSEGNIIWSLISCNLHEFWKFEISTMAYCGGAEKTYAVARIWKVWYKRLHLNSKSKLTRLTAQFTSRTSNLKLHINGFTIWKTKNLFNINFGQTLEGIERDLQRKTIRVNCYIHCRKRSPICLK